VRTENQDRISRFRSPLGEVFAVADGMGGHLDGGRAAEAAIAVLEEHLGRLEADAPVGEALQCAVDAANGELRQLSEPAGSPGTSRMGATLVLALLRGPQAFVAHAGDSRAYLLRGGALEPLTRDHTLVQQMVDHQVLSEEEARNHPDAGVVTRALGQRETIQLEVAEPFELQSGDRLLLCSDGLCGYVDDAAIASALAEATDAQEATDRLIDLALAAGGEDNVSVQVVQVEEGPPSSRREPEPAKPPAKRPAPRSAADAASPSRLSRFWLGLAAGALVVLATGLVLAWTSGLWRPTDPSEADPPEQEEAGTEDDTAASDAVGEAETAEEESPDAEPPEAVEDSDDSDVPDDSEVPSDAPPPEPELDDERDLSPM
jgi:serine/threonine protein phosphatase PrpC